MVQKRLKDKRESEVEAQIVGYAEGTGWWQTKFVPCGKNHIPDRLFIKRGVVLFIEVKRLNEEARKAQAVRHKEMGRYGAKVYTVDTFDAAKDILDNALRVSGRP